MLVLPDSVLSPQSSLLSLVQQILQLNPHVVFGLEKTEVLVGPLEPVVADTHPERIPERPVNPRLNEIGPAPVVEVREARPQVPGKVLGIDGEGEQLSVRGKTLESLEYTRRNRLIRTGG